MARCVAAARRSGERRSRSCAAAIDAAAAAAPNSRARTDAAQSKTIETTLIAIQTGNDPNLPPLMNPAMLEASDDLTNLSHLNEPAGMP